MPKRIIVPEGLLHIGEHTFKVYSVNIDPESGPNSPGGASFEIDGNGALPSGPQILEVTGPGSLPNRRYSITVFGGAKKHTPSRSFLVATGLTLIP